MSFVSLDYNDKVNTQKALLTAFLLQDLINNDTNKDTKIHYK